ncbi:hypothetical protein [Leptolyngbya sp. PCC 6406]|uniref:hypothetical protein n=1 Tax=Leptolyngbya sp. PCC 6406 TaxID=1173264 RepID=UPI0002AC6CA3|nr:hypothetical protein [Leptolyngbya sp. PCC 6406]
MTQSSSRSSSTSQSSSTRRYIPSEAYRAMLVRDGERRFKEWHKAFLQHQKAYLQDLERRRKS